MVWGSGVSLILSERESSISPRNILLVLVPTFVEKARAIRELVAELKERNRGSSEPFPAEKVDRWSTWAEALASQQDPFDNGYLEEALEYEALHGELEC